METGCWCLSDAWGLPSLAKVAHSSERSRTHCAVGGTAMPAPNAKCLGVLLWGPAEAVIQGGSVAGPRGWFRCCQERGFSDGEGSRGGGAGRGTRPTPPVWGARCAPLSRSWVPLRHSCFPRREGASRRSLRFSGAVSPLTPCQCVFLCTCTQSLCSAYPWGWGG